MSKRHNNYNNNKAFNSNSINNTNGRDMNNTYLNEAGVFEAMMHSNTPEAKEFQNELFTKILPSIRRFGYYATPNKRIEDNINNLQGNHEYPQNRWFDDTATNNVPNNEPTYSNYQQSNNTPDDNDISDRLTYNIGFTCNGSYDTLEDIAVELNDLLDTDIDAYYLKKALVDMGYLSFDYDMNSGREMYSSNDRGVIVYSTNHLLYHILLTTEVKLKLCGKVIDNIIKYVNRTKYNKQYN